MKESDPHNSEAANPLSTTTSAVSTEGATYAGRISFIMCIFVNLEI